MKKLFIREIEKLKDEKNSLDSRIKETLEECVKVEAEYVSMKSEMEAKSIQLAKIEDSQKIKIDKLDDMITDYEMKIEVLKDELKNLEASYRENSFEISKIKNEIEELKWKSVKDLKMMKGDLSKTNREVEGGHELEQNLEKSHQDAVTKVKEDFARRLKQTQDSFAARFRRAEEKYNTRLAPLLQRIQDLDAEIQDLEAKMEAKPKELKALRNKQAKILEGFSKITHYC